MNWTAQTLLHAVLEFVAMTPDRTQWNEAVLRQNKPRLLRFQRIMAAFDAFGITTPQSKRPSPIFGLFSQGKNQRDGQDANAISMFLNGAFIERRSLGDFTDLLPLMEENAIKKDHPTSLRDIQSMFWQLMSYRMAADAALRYNSGVLEASGKGFQAAIILTNKANKVFGDTVKPIDAILTHIIDPLKREINEATMVKDFGFPSDDLTEVDMENY